MSGQRQRVSRAESQQRTREELLDAAEELFLANGLGGTTVTKIAEAAGRTVGAIYSNFSSKENLCAEVLLRCYMRTFSEVAGRLIQSASSVDEQITELAQWSASLGRRGPGGTGCGVRAGHTQGSGAAGRLAGPY